MLVSIYWLNGPLSLFYIKMCIRFYLFIFSKLVNDIYCIFIMSVEYNSEMVINIHVCLIFLNIIDIKDKKDACF